MSVLQMFFSGHTASPLVSFSFSSSITGQQNHHLLNLKPSHLSFHTTPITTKTTKTLIRMGGGPRTFPGGVSKWQWKRMQAKKAKQLLKARLCRERQIYEMRKRAELKAAVSELERPWEVVEKAPNLFSVRADEQVKVLADRFQKPGGFDLWTDRDGPQLFETVDDLPSARFFPKGVVHSVKPYKRITGSEESHDLSLEPENDMGFHESGRKSYEKSSKGKLRIESFSEGLVHSVKAYKRINGSEKSRDLSLKDENYMRFHENGHKSNIRSSKGRLRTGSFSEGVVRSVEPYQRTTESEESKDLSLEAENYMGFRENGRRSNFRSSKGKLRSGSCSEGENSSDTVTSYSRSSASSIKGRTGKNYNSTPRYNGTRRRIESHNSLGSTQSDSRSVGFDRRQRVQRSTSHSGGERQFGRRNSSRGFNGSYSEVYDMRLEQDGTYGFLQKKGQRSFNGAKNANEDDSF